MHALLFSFFYTLSSLHPLVPSLVKFFAAYLPYLLLVGLLIYLLFARGLSFWKRFFIILGIALSSALSYLVVLIIRGLYQLPRPFVERPDITPLIEVADNGGASFPSAHAAVFFAIGTFLFLYHKRLGLIYLFAALLITISRVIAGVHWPLDILGGAVVGVLSALAIRGFTKSMKRHL